MKVALRFRFLLALALLLGLSAPVNRAAAQGTTTQRTCGKSTFLSSAAAATTQLVPTATDRNTGNTIFICGYTIVTAAADTITFVLGTGTNCGTGQLNITAAYPFAGAATLADGANSFRGLSVPAGQNLCVTTSTAGPAGITVYYDNNPL